MHVKKQHNIISNSQTTQIKVVTMRVQNINIAYLLTAQINNISYSWTAQNKKIIIRFQNINDAHLLTAQNDKK